MARKSRQRLRSVALMLGFACVIVGCGATRTLTQTVTKTATVTETLTRTLQAPQPIYVPETGGKPEYKPSGIYISADSGNIWVIKRWLSYGGEFADAIATTQANDCTPNCASGHRTTATTTIRLSRRIPCGSVPGYAGFEVLKSSDESVAPVGSEQDLEALCPSR
jgi:hypothetical protein